MNKFININKRRTGQLNAMPIFIETWTKFVIYWNGIKPQSNIWQQVLEIL